jgi:hypothetical protein
MSTEFLLIEANIIVLTFNDLVCQNQIILSCLWSKCYVSSVAKSHANFSDNKKFQLATKLGTHNNYSQRLKLLFVFPTIYYVKW